MPGARGTEKSDFDLLRNAATNTHGQGGVWNLSQVREEQRWLRSGTCEVGNVQRLLRTNAKGVKLQVAPDTHSRRASAVVE